MAKTKLRGLQVLLGLVLVFVVALHLSKGVSAAGNDYFTLSPASSSYKINSTVIITVHSNGSDPYNTVNAVLNYDKSKLQFVSVDMSSSEFTFPINNTNNGNGTATLTAGLLNTNPTGDSTVITGDHVVGSVSFKVLAGSGSTSIVYGSGSKIWQPTNSSTAPYIVNVWNGSTKGGTYALTGGTTTGTSHTTTGGTTSKTSTSTSKTTTTKSGSKTSTNPSSATSSVGYFVAIKVTDSHGKAVKGAKVTIDGQPAISYDSSGIASFVGISAGQHTVGVDANGKHITKSITVKPGAPYTVQQFGVSLASSISNLAKAVATAAAIVILIIIIGGGSGLTRAIRSHGLNRDLASHFPKPTAAVQTTNPPPVSNTPVVQSPKPAASPSPATQVFTPDPKNLTNGSKA